jgi:hypothetical protein
MFRFEQRNDPEAMARLVQAAPAKRYAFEQMKQIMDDLVGGLVNNGVLLESWGVEKETDHWYQVIVGFGEVVYETWYFFKPESVGT